MRKKVKGEVSTDSVILNDRTNAIQVLDIMALGLEQESSNPCLLPLMRFCVAESQKLKTELESLVKDGVVSMSQVLEAYGKPLGTVILKGK